MPSKPFMTGGSLKVPRTTNLAKKIPTSDGMAALEMRLSGAKKNKAMKPPTAKGRQKQDFSMGNGLMPGKGM